MERELKPGDHVIYVDTHRRAHHALVTTWWLSGRHEGDAYVANKSVAEFKAVHGADTMPCVNLVFVLDEPDRRDQYGNQKQHESSVTHGDCQTPPRLGNYWLFPHEFEGEI